MMESFILAEVASGGLWRLPDLPVSAFSLLGLPLPPVSSLALPLAARAAAFAASCVGFDVREKLRVAVGVGVRFAAGFWIRVTVGSWVRALLGLRCKEWQQHED